MKWVTTCWTYSTALVTSRGTQLYTPYQSVPVPIVLISDGNSEHDVQAYKKNMCFMKIFSNLRLLSIKTKCLEQI